MHVCADEVLALVAALPFLGVALNWLRKKAVDIRVHLR
jgi:hypothetical protein